jgi:hypothetical protein|tara:strand:- start:53 stop:469 length:417 start_codon:yes stop_codon:yes gene_type:complete
MKKLIKNTIKEYINEEVSVTSDMDVDRMELIQKFVDYVCDRLDIQGDVFISLQGSRDGLTTTAQFNTQTNHIDIYSNGRHPVDICRSIAHELVHQKQLEEDRLYNGAGEDGTDIENEANSVAGVMIREFGRQNPEIYE